jgi:hypothetical protein
VPDHPDREQLAAYEAGDGDRRQRSRVEAHLVGCPACAEVVAGVGRGRQGLALLDEPELPAGLHDRLAAAVDREQASSLPARRAAWWRRPAALAAAAALLVAVALLPLLHLTGGGGASTASGRATAASSAAQAPVGPPRLAALSLPGEFSAARLRKLLAANPDAHAAVRAAAAGPQLFSRSDRSETAGRNSTSPGATDQAPKAAIPGALAGGAAAADQPACVAAATRAAGRPVRAAFLLETSFQGRPATLLVAAGPAGQVEVYAFPRDDCSGAPLAVRRVATG